MHGIRFEGRTGRDADPGAAGPAVKALVFDFDGTLVDSEPNYLLADQQALARHGVAFTEEDKRRYIGISNEEQMRDLVSRHRLDVAPSDLAALKAALYLPIAEADTRVFPEMRGLLERARARGLRLAVASGSPPAVLAKLVSTLGLTDAFHAVVSAEEVPRGKPAPDVFLEAARRVGVAPEACVAFEDAAPGVRAAVAAGMRCVAVPTLCDPPLDPAFERADLLFERGMSAFSAEATWRWLAPRLG